MKSDYLLIRQGDGVIETAEDDIFSDKYIERTCHKAGLYKVMLQKDWGDYKTTKRMRVFELREYAAESNNDENPKSIKEKIKEFDAMRKEDEKKAMKAPGEEVALPEEPVVPDIPVVKSGVIATKPKDDYRIVRIPGGNSLKVIDAAGNEVLSDFTFDQLQMAKEQFSSGDGKSLTKSDLNNQQFIQFVLVFLGGIMLGAVGTFIVLKQQHAKEMNDLHKAMDAMNQKIQQMSAPKFRSVNDFMISEYNRAAGGPQID